MTTLYNIYTQLYKTLHNYTQLYKNFPNKLDNTYFKTKNSKRLNTTFQTKLYTTLLSFSNTLYSSTTLYKDYTNLYNTIQIFTELHKTLHGKALRNFSKLFTTMLHNFTPLYYKTSQNNLTLDETQHCTQLYCFVKVIHSFHYSTTYYKLLTKTLHNSKYFFNM